VDVLKEDLVELVRSRHVHQRPHLDSRGIHLEQEVADSTLVNGGQSDEFGEIMRPGDVIRSRSRLAEYSWKTTRFGPTLFITNEELWLNQRDETVRRRLSTTAAYRTGDAS
jgi:hypothetical protein